ncbi:MAG TPA: hypothetical protein PLA68_02100 [Panacibacter sp.]|nr:hypothetical protein [Panacibacter sp.]
MKTFQALAFAFILQYIAIQPNLTHSSAAHFTGTANSKSYQSRSSLPASGNAEAYDAGNKELEAGTGCTPPAKPGPITGTPEACFGLLSTYTISPVPGATSYVWTVLGGAIQSSTGTRITVRFGHGGRSVSVKAANSCGLSASSSKSVIVINCLQ